MRTPTVILAVVGIAACSAATPDQAPAQTPQNRQANMVIATGCFWCTESDFDKVPGVLATTSGYIGGNTANPTYEQVSAGGTGHIEAVRVIYDPSRVSYATLARHALRTSDPTDGGGQFCDRGDQYRPAIFFGDASERKTAVAATAEAAKALGKPIATDILPRTRFFSAEGYHQNYYTKNPLRYRYYRLSCGRDARIKELWG
ncbi:peptide-methionine (S)-S-oxide reductase MsrA [Sphingomonas suaedae]|nr:peptide-methionine (S)-S-oxide reductase MsrA [Sphingomonas suaedae]